MEESLSFILPLLHSNLFLGIHPSNHPRTRSLIFFAFISLLWHFPLIVWPFPHPTPPVSERQDLIFSLFISKIYLDNFRTQFRDFPRSQADYFGLRIGRIFFPPRIPVGYSFCRFML